MKVTLLHQHLGKGGMDDRIAALLNAGTYSSLRVLMAFAKGTGVGLISPALESFMSGGGTVEVIVGLDMDGTSPDALDSLVGTGATVFAFGMKGDRTFHPKVMMFDSTDKEEFAVIVGSNNWTPGGLDSNFEVAMEVSAKRSESSDAEALRKQVETLWKTYRKPYKPLLLDKHLVPVTDAKIAGWAKDMPSSGGSAPDERRSTLADRVFAGLATKLPRKPLRRPPRKSGAPNQKKPNSKATKATTSSLKTSGVLPKSLYLVVLGSKTARGGETSRGGEIQLPKESLVKYFGIDPDEDTLWVTLRHEDGTAEVNRKVGLHPTNSTYRLSSGKFAAISRPFVLQLDRIADDEFDVKLHEGSSQTYAKAKSLATEGGTRGKLWGTA